MSDYEIYNLIVCLVVFVILVFLSVICVTAIVKLYKRLIACGQEDDNLIAEYQRLSKKRSKIGDVLAAVFNALIFIIFAAIFVFAIVLNAQDAATSNTMATFRVVKSSSMSEKYSGNTYLFNEDNAAAYGTLDYQFDTFDLILTYKTPAEEDLELYDVVVYDFDGELVIHRIISIEEANDAHEGRLFTLRGDANATSDAYQVEYSQIKGIYRGERVRFVGSVILFFQSPAGWLCIILIAAAIIIAPMVESYLGKRKYRRLVEIGVITDEKLLAEISAEQNKANFGGKIAGPPDGEPVNMSLYSAPVTGTPPVVLSVAEGPRGGEAARGQPSLRGAPEWAQRGNLSNGQECNGAVAISVNDGNSVQSYIIKHDGSVIQSTK